MKTNQKYLDLLGKMKSKKISLNIEEKTLDLVDDLAKITEANRTVILLTLIGQGISPLVQFLEKEWNRYEKEKKADPKKIKEMKTKLASFKKKWNL